MNSQFNIKTYKMSLIQKNFQEFSQVIDENSEIAMLSSVELTSLMQNNLEDISTDLLNNSIGSLELEGILNKIK